MKNYKSLYQEFCSINNLFLAYKKARKGKTKRDYVKEFERDIIENLFLLYEELKNETYLPKPLEIFILRDPKTRKISKADFRDRIVHHGIVHVLESIFDKIFIYDSCANQKCKGNLFALKRFDLFKRKVTNNLKSKAFCLKADIKHYFEEVDHKILIRILERKLSDKKLVNLIMIILKNGQKTNRVGMPLGNLTSQFFANVYLNELDYFIKHKLKAKYYIRYVDDFVILHKSKSQLELWKEQISEFLNVELKLELHKDKSRIISLSRGIDFVGFRNYYHFRLLRKRNIKNMKDKVALFEKGYISKEKLLESFQGWQAYAKGANTYNLRKKLFNYIQ